MPKQFDYTARARKFTLSFPRLTYISIQVNFWTLAYLLLSFILNLSSRAFAGTAEVIIQTPWLHSVIISLCSGVVYGGATGFIDLLLGRRFFKGRSLGIIIIVQAVSNYAVLLLLLFILRFGFWESMVVPYAFGGISPLDDAAWKYLYYIILLYTLVMTFVISFINQMNRQFGPGILLPLLFGKYRTPKEEQRIFMFMDMKSSTSHAERLGHLAYSALVRDCFLDINTVLSRHHAEIYQYVGDEIVLSWSLAEGLHNHTCFEFYFACQQQLNERRSYYTTTYGFLPEFKAGLHLGMVTAVEVGEVRRNIAYHGDTLNTASRIQSVCNQYGKTFLISEDVHALADPGQTYDVRSLGHISLKGKEHEIEIFSVAR